MLMWPEIPSNIVLKKVRPSLWLSFLVVSWGLVMTCQGLVKNFEGLLACRVMLGLAEVSRRSDKSKRLTY